MHGLNFLYGVVVWRDSKRLCGELTFSTGPPFLPTYLPTVQEPAAYSSLHSY